MKCNDCGRPIKFIHVKGQRKKVAVNPRPYYFTPGGEQFFVTYQGYVFGTERCDGRLGYKAHNCK